ncbi:hypothetical protein M1247_09965 [Mycobacterium sp. 21AC1]|uniref:hypothetical protein n=1 Tax=[Mycobacterium] appelbergii TaxID=2939269 RepID=UPI00293926C8|nr:hypothetical protein [Mycobacterium sp. 21AC1]MDV3125235.1 hypothetical protein [Mycobacterium sp. 21AC1]
MIGRVSAQAVLVIVLLTATACDAVVSGQATWPGATLDKVVLTAADFPAGVQYDRVSDDPGRPDGAGGPPAMLSSPEGCSDGLTRVIARSAERGPGSAAQFVATYDGARMVLTVLSSPLRLDQLEATAERCAEFRTYFDPSDPGIPMTTTKLPTRNSSTLAYQQTMRLSGAEEHVYFAFANIDGWAVFGIAFPAANPSIPVKATLPQTFLDTFDMQTDRLELR